MDKFIYGYINSVLADNETIQPEAAVMLEVITKKIIEAGLILKDTGEYRYGSGDVTADNLVKRVINNVSKDLRILGGHRVGLINTTEANLVQQHNTLVIQIMIILKTIMDDGLAKKIASDIADILLTSWFLVLCKPNESGWGGNWTIPTEYTH